MRRNIGRLADYLPAVLAAALPVVWVPSAFDSFVLPRASLVIAGACLGIGLVLITGRESNVSPLRWPLLAASGAAFLALLFSVSWPLSTAGSYLRYESWPMRIAYLGLFVTAADLARTSKSRDWVIRGFVLGTAVASAEAVWQATSGASFRPDGNVGNANLLGALIAMAVPLAIGRGIRRSPYLFMWALAVAVMAAGLVVSTSRSGALGAGAGALALVVMSQRGRRAAAAFVGASVLVAGGLWAILFSPLRFLNSDPGATRLNLWPDAVKMIEGRPVTGWGEDTVGLVFGQYLRPDYGNVIFDRAHSGLLDLLATQGVIGALALGWLLVAIGIAIWRNRFADSVAMLGAAAVGYTVWVAFNFDWAPATGPFWLLVGTAWAAARFTAPAEHPPTSVLEATSPVADLAAVALVLVGIALGVMPLLADVWYFHGQASMSVIVDPLQAQYHRGYGEELVAKGSIRAGVEELRAAAQLGASDPSLYVELGDLEARLGDNARARDDYRRALQIDPRWSPAAAGLARLASS
jgi:O-antigen ligase